MLQSRAVPGQNRFLVNTGCCRAEQILNRIDSWKRQDVAEQRSSWIEQIHGKDRMLQSRAGRRAEKFVEGKDKMLHSREICGDIKKTGCCRAKQFVVGKDSWKSQDAAEQKNQENSFTFNMFFLQKLKRNLLYCLLKIKDISTKTQPIIKRFSNLLSRRIVYMDLEKEDFQSTPGFLKCFDYILNYFLNFA